MSIKLIYEKITSHVRLDRTLINVRATHLKDTCREDSCIIRWYMLYIMIQDSSVAMAMGYRLEGRGWISGRGKKMFSSP
jgi:hypothetical protein